MNSMKFMDGTPVNARYYKSIAAINNILANIEDEVGIDALETYAASHQVEAVKSETITFYFGDRVIGEVKFVKAGTKEQKINRFKKTLMKQEIKTNPASLIGQLLFSPFCKFKIN